MRTKSNRLASNDDQMQGIPGQPIAARWRPCSFLSWVCLLSPFSHTLKALLERGPVEQITHFDGAQVNSADSVFVQNREIQAVGKDQQGAASGRPFVIRHARIRSERTILRDQTWNRSWNRLSPKALQRRRNAPSKSLRARVLQHMLPGC